MRCDRGRRRIDPPDGHATVRGNRCFGKGQEGRDRNGWTGFDGQPLSKYWRRGIPFDALIAIAMQSINALGAALGVFLAGFWLLESLGVRGAGWAAAAVFDLGGGIAEC